MFNYEKKTYAKPGERYEIECAFSEVCMHMRIAGERMLAELVPDGPGRFVVQLYNLDGTYKSFPILTGEAGFYHDAGGYYFYPAKEAMV